MEAVPHLQPAQFVRVCDGVCAHVLPLRTHAGDGGDAD